MQSSSSRAWAPTTAHTVSVPETSPEFGETVPKVTLSPDIHSQGWTPVARYKEAKLEVMIDWRGARVGCYETISAAGLNS